jgi:hypothetical protein
LELRVGRHGLKLHGTSNDPLPPLPEVRTGQTPTKLTKEEYLKRWRERDRYVGYYKPYAVSHDELDRDDAIFEETRNAARALV